MRLQPRIEKLSAINAKTNRGKSVLEEGITGGWGKDFMKWRINGHAFSVGQGEEGSISNTTLASIGKKYGIFCHIILKLYNNSF